MDTHYLAPQGAQHKLAERQALKPAVEQWWQEKGWPVPPVLTESRQPLGVLMRQVATWRYEDELVERMAVRDGFRPFCLEYTADAFTRFSTYKRALLQRHIVLGTGRNGGLRCRSDRLVANLERWQNRSLCDIHTDDGRNLVDVHHSLRRAQGKNDFWDASTMLREAGLARAHDYYACAFSWFVAHAVQFEDYHDPDDPTLAEFTRRVVEPAWREVQKKFGVAPLIVRVPGGRRLNSYPELG